MKEVIYGGSTEVPGLLSLPHTRLHFFFSFPCDIAVLIWLHWWFLWERDYFSILKLAQERCWHLFLSKSGSACHWLCYKVPPILISGKECSQASPSDRCTILLSMGSCKYMTKNVPRKVEQWLVPLPLKRILVHHQTRQVWIITSPYFPPLKIPLVLELYRSYKKINSLYHDDECSNAELCLLLSFLLYTLHYKILNCWENANSCTWWFG